MTFQSEDRKPLTHLFQKPSARKHPDDYDWFELAGWQSKDFYAYASARRKCNDIELIAEPKLDLTMAHFTGSFDDEYVFEGVEFEDGTCMIAWSVSEFVDTFRNDIVVKYFLLRPRVERWTVPERPKRAKDRGQWSERRLVGRILIHEAYDG